MTPRCKRNAVTDDKRTTAGFNGEPSRFEERTVLPEMNVLYALEFVRAYHYRALSPRGKGVAIEMC